MARTWPPSGQKEVRRSSEGADWMSRVRAACSAPLIPNRQKSMGLDCLPVSCDLRREPGQESLSCNMTHLPDEPCPFEADENPIGILGTCCSLRGKVAAFELDALGEDRLCAAMYKDMTASEAIAFAAELNEAASRLESEHAGKKRKPKGAAWGQNWDPVEKKWVGGTHTTFDEALSAIRQAARWYDKVGRLGCSVHAWY